VSRLVSEHRQNVDSIPVRTREKIQRYAQPFDNRNKKTSSAIIADGPNTATRIAAGHCSLTPSTSSGQRMALKDDQQTPRGFHIKSSLKPPDALSAQLASSLRVPSANSDDGFGTTVRSRKHAPHPGSSESSSRTVATASATTDRNRSQRLAGSNDKSVQRSGGPTGRDAQTLRPIRSVPDTTSNGVPIVSPRPGSRPPNTRLGPRPTSGSMPAGTHQRGGKVHTTTGMGPPHELRQLYWGSEVPARRKEERKARRMKEKMGERGRKGAEGAGNAGGGAEVVRVKIEEPSMSIVGSAGPGSLSGFTAAGASTKKSLRLQFSKNPKTKVRPVVFYEGEMGGGEVR
jgi:hypothetical protein